MPPDDLEQHRTLIIEQIYKAFNGVSRANGVSWSESVVIDRHGSDEEERQARTNDKDRSWAELIDDADWEPYPGVGGFVFLDAIGFRYYLPVAMIRCARAGEDVGMLTFQLDLPSRHYAGIYKRSLEMWSLMTDSQRTCVAAFVRFMIRAAEEHGYEQPEEWQRLLDEYWHQFG